MFQSIPGRWIWFYYICPVAWTLRGVICSQLGDVETIIVGPGFEGTVKKYLEVTFGYGPNMIGASIAALVGFCLLFFIVFALSVKFLNFQKRWASDLLSRDDRCFCRMHQNQNQNRKPFMGLFDTKTLFNARSHQTTWPGNFVVFSQGYFSYLTMPCQNSYVQVLL